jgi:hypothetical protein
MSTTKTKLKSKPKPKLPPGARFYPYQSGELPSVTTILSATESDSARNRLEQWGRDWDADPLNQGKTRPTERGSFVDALLTSYLQAPVGFRTTPSTIGIAEDVVPYIESLINPVNGTVSILSQFGEMWWAQGLLPTFPYSPEKRLWRDSDHIPRKEYVASSKGWAGVPDFIGEFGGIPSLISLKTSDKLYYKTAPDWKDLNERKALGERPTPQWSAQFSGYKKYEKARMQEVAYKAAVEETLGLYIQQIVVLVLTPQRPQVLTLKQYEIDKAWESWLGKVELYSTMYPSVSAVA